MTNPQAEMRQQLMNALYALCQYDGIKDTKRFLDTYQHNASHLGKSVLLWRNENQTRTYATCISKQ